MSPADKSPDSLMCVLLSHVGFDITEKSMPPSVRLTINPRPINSPIWSRHIYYILWIERVLSLVREIWILILIVEILSIKNCVKKQRKSHRIVYCAYSPNTLRPRKNEQHFADDIFKRTFFNENVWISIKISQKFVPKGPNNNIPALVQIMAWRPSGNKPLSEPMMVSLLTHICITRPQWVKSSSPPL